jgi:uncharacterized LabA/DUF88 family protein
MFAKPPSYTPARWMQFVDGENLTIRAQELLKECRPLPESKWYRRDCFIWPASTSNSLDRPVFVEVQAIRSFYYTSLTADDDTLRSLREQIWSLGFEPHVFKKVRREQKAKGVDMALTKDMLSHAFRGNYDVAVLIAGDGDYTPLVEEVKRLGKRVVVRFFDSTINSDLRLSADHFLDLTPVLLNWQGGEQARGVSA